MDEVTTKRFVKTYDSTARFVKQHFNATSMKMRHYPLTSECYKKGIVADDVERAIVELDLDTLTIKTTFLWK